MMNPSPPAYHLGQKVTAYAALTSLAVVVLSLEMAEYWVFPKLGPVWAVVTIIVPIVSAEPARRKEHTHRFGPANGITLFRAALIGLIANLIGSEVDPHLSKWAAIIAIIALSLDGVDGWIARKTKSESAYGAQLDMEVDSVFTLLLSFLVYSWGHAGPWVLLCGLARYLWMVASVCLPWFNRTLPPSFRRKTACVIAVACLSMALGPWSLTTVNTGLALSATLAIAGSFAIDGLWLFKRRDHPLDVDLD
jgi:phosphatidylglycerophosphate synthase